MRNYNGEMDKLLLDRCSQQEFVPAIVAHDVLEELLASDPDLVQGWLTENAARHLTGRVGELLRSQRSRAGARKNVFRFIDNLSPQGELISPWSVKYCCDADNTWKPTYAMTKQDVRYVAGKYEASERRAKFEKTFWQSIDKKLSPGQRISDVYDQETFDRMYESFRK